MWVDDIQLELPLARQHARYMVGMGVEGVAARPLAWRWEMGTGNNGVWLGRAEAGTFLKLRGEGGQWEDPMYSYISPISPLYLPISPPYLPHISPIIDSRRMLHAVRPAHGEERWALTVWI